MNLKVTLSFSADTSSMFKVTIPSFVLIKEEVVYFLGVGRFIVIKPTSAVTKAELVRGVESHLVTQWWVNRLYSSGMAAQPDSWLFGESFLPKALVLVTIFKAMMESSRFVVLLLYKTASAGSIGTFC